MNYEKHQRNKTCSISNARVFVLRLRNMQLKEAFRQCVFRKDVYKLSKIFFKFTPTKSQCEIIRTIAYAERKRVVISCMTRYGKTRCVSIGVCLYILLHKGKKVLQIAPISDQAQILRAYISEDISNCPQLASLLDSDTNDKLKKEVSKKRLTFKNGCEIMTLSAEGSGDRLMGQGGDLIICDEDCLIKHEVYRAKISRMLGDSPDSIMISIGNPWHMNNQMYDHWIDPNYYNIHIGWEKALKEGRISQDFLDEQKKTITPIEFTVLYESNFPDESDDQLIKLQWVKDAVNRFKIKKGEGIVASDPADKGIDWTVIMSGKTNEGYYEVDWVYSEAKSENVIVSGKIIDRQSTTHAELVNIDGGGLGTGIVSTCKDRMPNWVKINNCLFGGKSRDKKRFRNAKADMYFRLAKLFEEGMISIPDNEKLIKELVSIRWVKNDLSQFKILDPDKSPDYADCLVYFIWKDSVTKSGMYGMA